MVCDYQGKDLSAHNLSSILEEMDRAIGCLSCVDNCARKKEIGRSLLRDNELARKLILLSQLVRVLKKYVISLEKPWCEIGDISALTVAEVVTELSMVDPVEFVNWMRGNYVIEESDRFYLDSSNFPTIVNAWYEQDAPFLEECCRAQFGN